jgi:ribonuclease P protein component
VPSHTFSKAQRVRRRGEFGRVFDAGSRTSSRYFTVLVAAGHGPGIRLGIVASRKLGDAVHRNRAKRLIREIFRLMDKPEGASVDLIVIPRRELFDAPFSDLDRDFRNLWRRALARLERPHAQ